MTGGGSGGGGTGGGGGTACTPQAQNIVFDAGCANSLPSPGACGGNPVGEWCFTGYCADPSVTFAAVTTACPTATFSNIAGTVNGTLGFVGTAAAGAVTRTINWTLSGTINIPASCKVTAGNSCANVQAVLAAGHLTATCTDSSSTGGCTCVLGNNDNDNSSSSYVVDGGTLITGTRTFEYCVQGSSLRYRELGANALEGGTVGTVTK